MNKKDAKKHAQDKLRITYGFAPKLSEIELLEVAHSPREGFISVAIEVGKRRCYQIRSSEFNSVVTDVTHEWYSKPGW